MKNWKRILAALLALAMLFSMAAISEEQIAPEAAGEPVQAEEILNDEAAEESAGETPAGEEAVEEAAEEEPVQEPVEDELANADAMPAAPEVVIAPEWEYDAEIGAITIPYVELPETLSFEWSFDGTAAQYAVQTAPVPEGDNPEQRGERIYTTEPRIELPAANYAEGGWFSLYVTAVQEDGTEIEGWKYFRMERREALAEDLEIMPLAETVDTNPPGYSNPESCVDKRYSGTWLWPLGAEHQYCSSEVGLRDRPSTPGGAGSSHHHGTDIVASDGTNVFAARPGLAVKTYYGGLGNCVIIDHGDGFYTAYGHLSSFGDIFNGRDSVEVNMGDVIGKTGRTGNTQGNHLHFEIAYNNWGAGLIHKYGYTWSDINGNGGNGWGTTGWEIVASGHDYQNYVYEMVRTERISIGNDLVLNITDKDVKRLTPEVFPENVSTREFIWTSDDTGVVRVNNGELTLVGVGTATISCATRDGSGKSASCRVEVVDYVLDPKELVLGVGQTATISALQGEKKIKSDFTTSDTSIVSLPKKAKNLTGIKITAKAPGSATITATTKDGKTASCKVTVKPAPSSIEIESNLGKKPMNIGDTMLLSAKLAPSDAVSKVTWSMSSSDKKKKIVSLDANSGAVKGLKAGKVTITAKTHNNKSAKFSITIIDPTMPTDIAMSIDGVTPLEDGNYRVVYVDETFTPKPILYPNTAESKLEWKSSNTKIATVKNGVITPKKKGRAKITVWPKKTGKKVSATIYVDVEDPQPPKTITGLSVKTLGVGDTWQFVYSLSPENARTSVSYKSSKSSVASVDESGLVQAKKTGSATITATTHNGKKTKCKITVKKAFTSLQLDRESVELSVNGTYQLTCFIQTGTGGTITFTSSDKAIASVSESALITAHKEGSCVITAKTQNGLRADCVVTVRSSSEPTGVSLGISETIHMKVGERLQLKATVYPANAKTTLTWKTVKNSAQGSVIKYALMLDQNGLVTAIHEGTGSVRVFTSNNHYDTVNIVISKADDGSTELYSEDVMEVFYQINARRTKTTPVVIDEALCKRAETRLHEIKDSGSKLVPNEAYGSGYIPIAGTLSLHAERNKAIAEMLSNPSYRKVGIAVVLLGVYKYSGCYMLIFE